MTGRESQKKLKKKKSTKRRTGRRAERDRDRIGRSGRERTAVRVKRDLVLVRRVDRQDGHVLRHA